MSRLIDADDLRKQFDEGCWNDAVAEVDAQPTAYDVEAVVEELEDYSMWKDFMIYDLAYRERKIIERAIEIVKRGDAE